MPEIYVRFVVARKDEDSDHQMGIFQALYEMSNAGELLTHEEDWFRTMTRWFNTHLEPPSRFNWSTRPNVPRRAITWMKMSATDHVTKLRELATLLGHKDVDVEELRTEKPGYVLYEDAFQVAAMPFTDETL